METKGKAPFGTTCKCILSQQHNARIKFFEDRKGGILEIDKVLLEFKKTKIEIDDIISDSKQIKMEMIEFRKTKIEVAGMVNKLFDLSKRLFTVEQYIEMLKRSNI